MLLIEFAAAVVGSVNKVALKVEVWNESSLLLRVCASLSGYPHNPSVYVNGITIVGQKPIE